MNILCKIKAYLISVQDGLNRFNQEEVEYLVSCIDELILDRNRITIDEVLQQFECCSEHILGIELCYYLLKSYRNNNLTKYKL